MTDLDEKALEAADEAWEKAAREIPQLDADRADLAGQPSATDESMTEQKLTEGTFVQGGPVTPETANVGGASPARRQTLGEYRVGVTFNPGGHPAVNTIKAKAAELIDLIAEEQNKANGTFSGGEAARCASLAMTAIEEGAMWAVKCVTKPPRT